MNRGARRAPIFGEAEARDLFVELLAELPARFGLVLHGYVVMPNHFHLTVRTPRANLSQVMRHLGALFTQRLNALRGWDGPVFRGRFKNRLVDESGYWRHLVAYLHLNPVPALVERPEDWAWSSHRAYAGLEPAPDWLHTTELLDEFGSRRQLLEYVEAQRVGRASPPHGWDEDSLWTPVDTGFLEALEPDVDVRPVLAREALAEVEQITGVSEEILCTSRRGRFDNRARWVCAWWLPRRAALTQRQAARYLGCRAPSVAAMQHRLRQLLESGEDDEVRGWMDALDRLARQ